MNETELVSELPGAGWVINPDGPEKFVTYCENRFAQDIKKIISVYRIFEDRPEFNCVEDTLYTLDHEKDVSLTERVMTGVGGLGKAKAKMIEIEANSVPLTSLRDHFETSLDPEDIARDLKRARKNTIKKLDTLNHLIKKRE